MVVVVVVATYQVMVHLNTVQVLFDSQGYTLQFKVTRKTTVVTKTEGWTRTDYKCWYLENDDETMALEAALTDCWVEIHVTLTLPLTMPNYLALNPGRCN